MNPDRPPDRPPGVVFEDEHLLVVNKPAGWNTHAPSPYAGEGIYDWLRHREPRWAGLAILHRLDKETSGVLVFGKTPLANRSLTGQFTGREVTKVYRFWTASGRSGPDLHPVGAEVQPQGAGVWRVVSHLQRAGDHQVSRRRGEAGERAETEFRRLEVGDGWTAWEARPRTGRTHQIRVQAAAVGLPVLGDPLYGGAPSRRLWLHAERLAFRHPESGVPCEFMVPPPEPGRDGGDAWSIVRAIIDPAGTDAFRWLHGAGSGYPGLQADRLGPYVLLQSGGAWPSPALLPRPWPEGVRGWYGKQLRRDVRQAAPGEAGPRWLEGEAAPERFVVRENGVRYELSFAEGYSVGLFLDQRDNRRRFLVNHVAGGFPVVDGGWAGREVLNTFAYTGAFSVCAARAGARATSLDLSRKYLDWARRNFVLNGLDPAGHDFIYGDCFDWLRRLAKKGRRFDVVVLDPPTFSRSKEQGDFRVERDYGRLVEAALPVLRPGGTLLASANTARLEPERFVGEVRSAVARAGRRLEQEHYAPQPPDFPVHRDEPAYLKTVWARVG